MNKWSAEFARDTIPVTVNAIIKTTITSLPDGIDEESIIAIEKSLEEVYRLGRHEERSRIIALSLELGAEKALEEAANSDDT